MSHFICFFNTYIVHVARSSNTEYEQHASHLAATTNCKSQFVFIIFSVIYFSIL